MLENIALVLKSLDAHLKSGQLNDFLLTTTEYFSSLGTTPRLQGTAILSPEFDRLCQLAGQKTGFGLYGTYVPPSTDAFDVVLITEVFNLGGHVELLRDLVRNIGKPLVLVVTNINQRQDPVHQVVRETCPFLDVVEVDEIHYLNRLRRVQSVLAHPSRQRIWLLAHGYDAVANSAITPAVAADTWFLHHCDHYPTLGCYLPGVTHIDLHPLAFHRCRYDNNLHDNRYLCLTSAGEATPSPHKRFSKPHFVSVSCGSTHKMRGMSYHIDFREVLLALLQTQDGYHFHVGHLSDIAREEIRRCLQEYQIEQDRFCCLGEVPGLANILVHLGADLYVPTLPQSGGKAIIDAMSVGVPVLVHHHARDRMWGSSDIAYPEALRWRTVAELRTLLENLDATQWQAQAAASLAYFQTYHAPSHFAAQCVEPARSAEMGAVPPLKPYWPDASANLRFAALAVGANL